MLLLPEQKYEDTKNGLQSGSGKEKEISRYRDPDNSFYLAVRGYLIDGTERLQDGLEAVGKNSNFTHTHNRDKGEQHRVEEDHSFRGVEAKQKAGNVGNFEDNQERHQSEKGNHWNSAARCRMEVLLENVGPVNQYENKDAKERQGPRTEHEFGKEGTHPCRMLVVPGENRNGRVAGSPYRGRNQEPNGPEDRGQQD